MIQINKQLPKNPKTGSIHYKTITTKGKKRKIGFQATGKQGFGKWKIISNEPA